MESTTKRSTAEAIVDAVGGRIPVFVDSDPITGNVRVDRLEGGEESALFAGDMLRMYTRYAEARGWRGTLTTPSPPSTVRTTSRSSPSTPTTRPSSSG